MSDHSETKPPRQLLGCIAEHFALLQPAWFLLLLQSNAEGKFERIKLLHGLFSFYPLEISLP